MAITTLEAANLAANNGEFKKAGILMTFAEQSMLLGATPFVDIAGNAYKWTRESALGTAASRPVNGSYTESSGATEEIFESLKIYGGDLDVDNFLIRTGGPEVRTRHEMLKIKAIAQKIGFDMVRGTVMTLGGVAGDPHGLDGLLARYGGGLGTSTVSTAGVNGGQLFNNSNAALSMARLDSAIMAVDRPTHILMAKKQAININTFLRGSASIQQTKDEFGRIVQTYNGLPILWADINGDQAALGFNENNNTTTSVLVLNLSEDGLHGIQAPGGLDVRDLQEQNGKPVFRTRAEWYLGMVDEHPRCVARVYNITDATAVA